MRTHGTVSPSAHSFRPSSLAGSSSKPFAPARLTVRLERWPPVEYAEKPSLVGRTLTRWYSGRGSSGTAEVSCGGGGEGAVH